MLVLSRKLDETILIDGNIEIQVLRVKGNTVRLGIKAPQDIRIVRGELAPFGLSEEADLLQFDVELNDLCPPYISHAG